MKITLTAEQIRHAEETGVKRNKYNRRIGQRNNPNFNAAGTDEIDIDKQGATGELAVALVLGLQWHPFQENYLDIKADVGENLQVRSTKWKTGNLLLNRRDKENQIFILARLHYLPTVEVVGWAYGHEVKRPEFLTDAHTKYPLYKFPWQKLKPLDSLPIKTDRPIQVQEPEKKWIDLRGIGPHHHHKPAPLAFVQVDWRIRMKPNGTPGSWSVFEPSMREDIASRFVQVHNKLDRLFEYRVLPKE